MDLNINSKKAILLGAGGTGTSFAIASRLRANWGKSIRLIVTDIYDKKLVTTSLLADTFYKVPQANDKKFQSTLERILRDENINTYIPILNDEIITAAKLLKVDIFNDIDFWSSDLYANCCNKIYADQLLKNYDIKTPQKIDLTSLKNEKGPWFVKPKDGIGSKGARTIYASEMNDLDQDFAEKYIVQEVCSAPEITVDSFYDAKQDIVYAYCRERLEIKSGVCTKARIFRDDEISIIAHKIAKAINQRGAICFQLMKCNDEWAVTDLNLRTGGGTALTCSVGFDVFSASYAYSIGEDYSPYVRQMNPTEEYFVTRQYSEFIMHESL